FEQTLFALTAQTATGGNVTSVAIGPGGRPFTQTHADSGPHSLTVTSFPAKEQETQAARTRGLARVKLAWELLSVVTFIGLVIGGFVALWYYSRWLFVTACVAGGVFLCVYSLSLIGTGAKSSFTRESTVLEVLDAAGAKTADRGPANE